MANITAELEGGTRVRVSAGTHQWYADELPDEGGSNMGPSPYELLLASLAACTAITLRLYAAHKGLQLGPVRLEYEHTKEVVADMALGIVAQPERISSRIVFTGEYTEPQRARLKQISGRCPVHKLLSRALEIVDVVEFE